jgi:hypothetical protein
MNLARFVNDRRAGWEELDSLVTQAGRRTEKLGPVGVRRLGDLYRATAADLATARRAFPGDPLGAALEQRVGRARYLVYGAHTRRASVLEFFKRGYWQTVRERRADLPALPTIPPTVAANPWSGWDTSRITPEELAAVRQFMDRRFAIEYGARVQLGDRLAERLRPKVTGVPPDVHGELFLERLVAAKLRTP